MRLDHRRHVPDFQIEPRAQTYPFVYGADELPDLLPSIARRYPDPDRRARPLGAQVPAPGRPTATGELLMTLTYGIKEGFAYSRRSRARHAGPGVTTLKLGRGSCRDFALLMMEAVRCLGFAARFVSGYIYVPPSRDERGLCRRRLDACLVPGLSAGRRLGRVRPDQRHRRQPRPHPRRGRPRPGQAVPLSGTLLGAATDELGMTVEVQVTTLQTPRDNRLTAAVEA